MTCWRKTRRSRATRTPCTCAGAAALATLPPTSHALATVRATADRLIDMTVCLRPFRAQGPRIESERRYGKTIVYHYGYGGQRLVTVVGFGTAGLTTARVAPQHGLRVRNYSKVRPPEVASTWAAGTWSPDSRYARKSTPHRPSASAGTHGTPFL